MLGPGVDAEVGLGDGDNAGHALGVELVEGLTEDSGAHLLGGGQEGFSDEVQVVQQDACRSSSVPAVSGFPGHSITRPP